tara:strand:- start:54 stop:257 length:204 start_codon:yes stop_codon:yes gene_type:complete
MSYSNRKHTTRRVSMQLENGSTHKKAGSNQLAVTVKSTDWRLPNQTVRMTIREAQALRSFLNSYLEQ